MARLWTRFFIIFWLIPGPDAGNQKGIPPVALILSAHGAEIRIVTYGPTGGSRRRPKMCIRDSRKEAMNLPEPSGSSPPEKPPGIMTICARRMAS